MKVAVISQAGYARPFLFMGMDTHVVDGVLDDPTFDLVVFTGGEDVSPDLYGEERDYRTFCNPARDAVEVACYEFALRHGMKMVGICRGAQFLNVMNGGRLHQHVEHHGQGHIVQTDDGREVLVTSTHHQMMIPSAKGELVAWAENMAFQGEKEPDVVFYPDTECLCVQYHPEYMNEDSDGFKYFIELMERFF